MTDLYLFTICALFIANLWTAFLYLRFKKKLKIDRKDSIELSEFLLDLLNGEGLIKVTRVNPTDVFLRSPRGR